MNPVAGLVAALLLAALLVPSIDPVSAGVALALELALLPLLRVPPRLFWRRTWPVWVAAPLAALTVALYGRASGTVYAEFLLVRISDGSLLLALATGLRVLAIGLPAVALFARIDPTEFADALGQRLRLPARFVLGALAGVRMLGLAQEDWRTVALARRTIARIAVEQLVRRIDGCGGSALDETVPHTLRIGTSCGCPRSPTTVPRRTHRPVGAR